MLGDADPIGTYLSLATVTHALKTMVVALESSDSFSKTEYPIYKSPVFQAFALPLGADFMYIAGYVTNAFRKICNKEKQQKNLESIVD